VVANALFLSSAGEVQDAVHEGYRDAQEVRALKQTTPQSGLGVGVPALPLCGKGDVPCAAVSVQGYLAHKRQRFPRPLQ